MKSGVIIAWLLFSIYMIATGYLRWEEWKFDDGGHYTSILIIFLGLVFFWIGGWFWLRRKK